MAPPIAVLWTRITSRAYHLPGRDLPGRDLSGRGWATGAADKPRHLGHPPQDRPDPWPAAEAGASGRCPLSIAGRRGPPGHRRSWWRLGRL